MALVQAESAHEEDRYRVTLQLQTSSSRGKGLFLFGGEQVTVLRSMGSHASRLGNLMGGFFDEQISRVEEDGKKKRDSFDTGATKCRLLHFRPKAPDAGTVRAKRGLRSAKGG